MTVCDSPAPDQEPPTGGHPLRPGASPGAIRAALITDGDRAEFDTDYERETALWT